tara:strand:+ start:412 stop:894 length:483 start_codon:yes stop_codon:yes gene_type:complete
MNVRVDVQQAAVDTSALSTSDIKSWVTRVIVATGSSAGGELSVRIVEADEMRRLNGEFRGKDSATNVLSFPAGSIDGLPDDALAPLGDLVVCASVVRDEAMAQGKAIEDHWAHMIVHGMLHLLGYDHENDDEAAEMEGKEIEILLTHGVANPYGESPRET